MVIRKRYNKVFIEEKILTANYPKKVTIFTMNFWKLIGICDSRWLNLRPGGTLIKGCRISISTLQSAPVARDFQYKVEVFCKEIIFDGPLGKTKYYAIHIDYQERGSPHVHSLMDFQCTKY